MYAERERKYQIGSNFGTASLTCRIKFYIGKWYRYHSRGILSGPWRSISGLEGYTLWSLSVSVPRRRGRSYRIKNSKRFDGWNSIRKNRLLEFNNISFQIHSIYINLRNQSSRIIFWVWSYMSNINEIGTA